MLPLARPLVTFDVESTGTSTGHDRIIELGLVRLDVDGTRSSRRFLLHPGCPIPPAATAVHRITDADVADAPGFVDVAAELAQLLTGVDLCGFNLRTFDVPILRAEFARAGVPWPCEGARILDAFVIFRDREPRTLEAAVKFYCGRSHEDAHTAEADAEATLDVLLAQLARYPDLPRDLDALDQASGGRQPDWATECGKIRWDAEGFAVFAFGKNNGKRVADVARLDPGSVRWILGKDFPADVKALCDAALRGRAPRRPAPRPTPLATAGDDFDDLIPF